MTDNNLDKQIETIIDLDDLRKQIQKLSQEISEMKDKTADAEETLQSLNALMERIEARKRQRQK